ncbi:MAG: O-antigen ligase family protein [Flavobacteriaceae bacterium]
MENIYNSLKNAFQNLIKENKENKTLIPFFLLLVTIPFPFAVNNIALGIFIISAIINFKKHQGSVTKLLVLPIILYLLMVVSCIWSIDKNESFKALSKEIPLLLIPVFFMLKKPFTKNQKKRIIEFYSHSMVLLAIFFLVRAVVRYFISNDSRVFFYHGEDYVDYGLVPKLLNAIHVSVFVAVAFFYFFSKEKKSFLDKAFALILFGFLLLLSSKNIVITVVLLVLIYIFFFSKSGYRMRLRNIIVLGLIVALGLSIGKIKQRFEVEFSSNTKRSLSADVVNGIPQGVHYVSIKEAWTNKTFTPNDYFPGTAFRVYQLRIFKEFLSENNIFFSGFGLNASYPMIYNKAVFYNLYMGNDGYHDKNFHNQYIQIFAELGVFGFLIIIIMLIYNLKNAIKSKDFVFFAFAFLMISLFLTESFLWRQRGVVFFTAFYCLFNSGYLHIKEPKQNE